MRQLLTTIFIFLLSFSLDALDPSTKSILVVGGAGYIGSHVNEMLQRKGYQTIVLDNLQTGHRKTVLHGTFIEGDISDHKFLNHIFDNYPIDAVMHFAALKNVGESTIHPIRYYQHNVANTLNLLNVMQNHVTKYFIFSSSATVFGNPVDYYMDEQHPCHPINPYGHTKLMVETLLKDLDTAYGMKYCNLRYFNAAGGDPRKQIKNYNLNESNLIPLVLRKIKNGDNVVTLNGRDYLTPDGTCIRDYVHIEDLGEAHILALERLFDGGDSTSYNLGNGRGFSVLEVLGAIEKVTNTKLSIIEGPRRAGDPATLVACSKKAQDELNWQPQHSSLESIVQDAWWAIE